MPRALTFPKPELMVFNDLSISDHNRSELSVDVERIETSKRMANGTMRKYVVIDKRSFSVSWNDLPSESAWTVDGFAGAHAIEQFYYDNQGVFTLYLSYNNQSDSVVPVMFTDFSKTLNKRAKNFAFYNVSLTMEEV